MISEVMVPGPDSPALDFLTQKQQMLTVTPPSQNDGVNQDHIKGFSLKREFTSICIQVIIIVF
jgi:hypothetical protein